MVEKQQPGQARYRERRGDKHPDEVGMAILHTVAPLVLSRTRPAAKDQEGPNTLAKGPEVPAELAAILFIFLTRANGARRRRHGATGII